MAIPPELAKFKSESRKKEDRFIQEFLIPLIRRLGYSVVNYHGTREHGRDLILAEIDRFGEVRYHGLQAKYEESISLTEIKDLIDDCEQAFTTPFQHPQGGAVEHISTFYAVNAGSFPDEARTRYFNALKPKYGANAKLIQGKDLVALDRWASINTQALLGEMLTGLVAEIQNNRNRLANLILPTVHQYLVDPQTPVSGVRLRDVAIGQYLARPISPQSLKYETVSNYCDQGRELNFLLDRLAALLHLDVKIKDAQAIINIAPRYVEWGEEIAQAANALLQQLGPISGL